MITRTQKKIVPQNLQLTLSREKLWHRYFKGSLQTKRGTEDELVHEYIPLVKAVVTRLAMTLPSHVDEEELYSSGLLGLLDAIRRYNPQNGCSFEAYARTRIRGTMLDELRRMDWIPRSVHEKARKVQNVMRQLEQTLGRTPTEEEMAKALKMPLSEYFQLLEVIKPVSFVCLDSARNSESEDGATQYEGVSDPSQKDPSDDTSNRELADLILKRLQVLPEMQRKVLALYYFEDLRLREIAEIFGVTESRICQIHAQAILSLKAYLKKTESSKV